MMSLFVHRPRQITDQPTTRPTTGPLPDTLRSRHLIITLRLPPPGQSDLTLPWVQVGLNLCDLMNKTPVKPETTRKLKRTRVEVDEGLRKSYEVEQKEEMGDPEEEKKTLKRKEEARRRAAMSDSERKKVGSRRPWPPGLSFEGEWREGERELISSFVWCCSGRVTARTQGTEEATTKGSVEAAQGGQVRATTGNEFSGVAKSLSGRRKECGKSRERKNTKKGCMRFGGIEDIEREHEGQVRQYLDARCARLGNHWFVWYGLWCLIICMHGWMVS
jgi:hypothetical protein